MSGMSAAIDILMEERQVALTKVDEMVAAARELKARLRDIEEAIATLQGKPLEPRSSRAAPGDLRARITHALRNAGTQGTTPKNIAISLTEVGRPTNESSVQSTLSRMKSESLVENVNGRWFIKPGRDEDPDVDPNHRPSTMSAEEAFGRPATSKPFGGSDFADDLADDVPF